LLSARLEAALKAVEKKEEKMGGMLFLMDPGSCIPSLCALFCTFVDPRGLKALPLSFDLPRLSLTPLALVSILAAPLSSLLLLLVVVDLVP
jgi:hypothetical protein